MKFPAIIALLTMLLLTSSAGADEPPASQPDVLARWIGVLRAEGVSDAEQFVQQAREKFIQSAAAAGIDERQIVFRAIEFRHADPKEVQQLRMLAEHAVVATQRAGQPVMLHIAADNFIVVMGQAESADAVVRIARFLDVPRTEAELIVQSFAFRDEDEPATIAQWLRARRLGGDFLRVNNAILARGTKEQLTKLGDVFNRAPWLAETPASQPDHFEPAMPPAEARKIAAYLNGDGLGHLHPVAEKHSAVGRVVRVSVLVDNSGWVKEVAVALPLDKPALAQDLGQALLGVVIPDITRGGAATVRVRLSAPRPAARPAERHLPADGDELPELFPLPQRRR